MSHARVAVGGFDSRLDLKVRLQEKPLLCESEANGSRFRGLDGYSQTTRKQKRREEELRRQKEARRKHNHERSAQKKLHLAEKLNDIATLIAAIAFYLHLKPGEPVPAAPIRARNWRLDTHRIEGRNRNSYNCLKFNVLCRRFLERKA